MAAETVAFPLVATDVAAPVTQAAWHDLLGLLFTLLVLLVAYKLTLSPQERLATVLPTSDCELQRESCQLSLADGSRFELRIEGETNFATPDFVVRGRSTSTTLRPLSLAIRSLEPDIAGPLQAFSDGGNADFRALASLPLCTEKPMSWLLTVHLDAAGRQLHWPIRFQSNPRFAPKGSLH